MEDVVAAAGTDDHAGAGGLVARRGEMHQLGGVDVADPDDPVFAGYGLGLAALDAGRLVGRLAGPYPQSFLLVGKEGSSTAGQENETGQ